jgi:uncharacterized protein
VTVLIDTSFLVALAITPDRYHAAAVETMNGIDSTMVIPVPVLPELFYMIAARGSYRSAVKIYQYIHSEDFQIEPLTPQDRLRMGEIMTKYLDAEFDFVDMAIMAISERLNITRVCTFDQRDFSIFRPKHCPYLELVPSA